MASDDMHVVMYKILAYLYACMKEGSRVDRDAIGAEALGINRSYWQEIMSELARRGYVKGVRALDGDFGADVYMSKPRVTMEGVEFLMENSMMAKAKQFLMDIKATIPGL